MSHFIEIRALGGSSFVRAGDVLAVQYLEPTKCNVVVAGGVSISCAEPAAQVKARIESALQQSSEMSHGHASR